MADAIKGNITIESGSVDKAAASIEALNASLKDSLKSAKALNAELKKTNATKSGKAKSGAPKSSGGSTAENSLKATNITKLSTVFGTALTNSVKIKDNIIEAGKITTQIKNEFSAMLKKVASANAKANASANASGNTIHVNKVRPLGEQLKVEQIRQDNRKQLERIQQANRIKLEQFQHSNRVGLYERRENAIRKDREERERRGTFRRNYYAERQFDMVRDQFIGHGFGTSFGVFKNLGGITRQKFFDWYINRQTKSLGLNPEDPDYQLKRSAIMHDLVNRGGGIARVVGLVGGVGLKVGMVLLKFALIVTKVIAKMHMMGAAIGALITAVGAATAVQEYDRYRGQMTKLMVSHDMFANNTILPFDEKAKHDYVNANYGLAHYLTNKYAMRGLDTVESGIRLAHLVGVGEGGGFKTDDEAMNFTRGLIAAAQVNGMTDAELQTLQYQGSQIASKGYAELLDIKPLMNSAPGIINDLIKFTGMSREELLKSGKTKALTWEKFKEMFVTNRSYYETLASRRDSQTINGQFQAAKQAFGLEVMGVSSSGIAEGGVKDIMQELAGSDLILVLGQMFGKIAGEFIKFFVMMFADEGDKSIRGAITNFGLTVIDFLGETAHIVVDLIGNVRMMWNTFGETFKSVIRFLADNPITRGILENVFGGKLPEWALSDDADSGEKYRVKTQDGREVVFGGDMKTKRVIDAMEKHEIAKQKAQISNEIAEATKVANVFEGMAAKGLVPKVIAEGITSAAEAHVNSLKARQNLVEVDRGELYQIAYREGEKAFEETKTNDVWMGSRSTDPTKRLVTEKGLFDRDRVIASAEAGKEILTRLDIGQTEETIQAQTDKAHGVINDAVEGAVETFQTRSDLPANRTTNDLLNEIANNTGKGKAALDRVTDVLVEFTKNRVINNITRVRPNVVVNFGDISDTSSINFAMSEMTSKLKHAIENVAGEDTVTLQIGGING